VQVFKRLWQEGGKIFYQIKNSEIAKPVMTALVYLLNKATAETEGVNTLIDLKRKYEGNYDFLKYISINNKADDDGMYAITIAEELDVVPSAKIAESLEKLIEEMGTSIEKDSEQNFIANLKIVVGDTITTKMKRMGIDLNKVTLAIRHQNLRITKKVLRALLEVLDYKTSKQNAITIVGETIVLLQGIHKILNYITINHSKDDINIFTFSKEINSIESYKLGAALRDVISIIQENHKTIPLIEDFKKQLGDEYLAEIEKLGVNLHFLALKYV